MQLRPFGEANLVYFHLEYFGEFARGEIAAMFALTQPEADFVCNFSIDMEPHTILFAFQTQSEKGKYNLVSLDLTIIESLFRCVYIYIHREMVIIYVYIDYSDPFLKPTLH